MAFYDDDLDDDERDDWGQEDLSKCDGCQYYDWQTGGCGRPGRCPYVGEY